MYCSNCGNKFKDIDKFCGCCGSIRYSVENSDSVENTPINPAESQVHVSSEKKGLPLWAILLICLGILIAVVIVVVIIAIVFLSFVVKDANESFEYDDVYEEHSFYVYIYEDSIPSLYNLLGEYDLCGVPDYGNENVLYYYCDDDINSYVFDEYLNILVDNHGYVDLEKDDNSRSIIIKSVQSGYNIIIDVNYNYDSIEYKRVKSELFNEDSSI